MKKSSQVYSYSWIIYLLLAFPLFYFTYKFGNPAFGANDFFDYYTLYKDFDYKHVDAPFNMRLLSSFFVYIFNKIGFNYTTETAFNLPDYDRQIFFNAILFNYLCVVSTCTVIFATAYAYFKDLLLSFTCGILYLLGFGTLFYEFMPITDSLSVLIFAICFNYYLAKSNKVIVLLIILILQREYIILAFGLISLLDYIKFRNPYYLKIILVCLGCLIVYYVLRKTIFYTPKYDFQASPTFFISNFFTIKFPLLMYLRQLLLTLNLFVLYLLVIGYKKMKRLKIDSYNFLKIILLFVQINLVTFAGGFGNNAGRIFYFMIPLILFYLIKEITPFLGRPSQESDSEPIP